MAVCNNVTKLSLVMILYFLGNVKQTLTIIIIVMSTKELAGKC